MKKISRPVFVVLLAIAAALLIAAASLIIISLSQLSLSSLPCSTSKGRTIMVFFNVKQLIYKQQGEYVSTLFEQNGYLSAKVNKIF